MREKAVKYGIRPWTITKLNFEGKYPTDIFRYLERVDAGSFNKGDTENNHKVDICVSLIKTLAKNFAESFILLISNTKGSYNRFQDDITLKCREVASPIETNIKIWNLKRIKDTM